MIYIWNDSIMEYIKKTTRLVPLICNTNNRLFSYLNLYTVHKTLTSARHFRLSVVYFCSSSCLTHLFHLTLCHPLLGLFCWRHFPSSARAQSISIFSVLFLAHWFAVWSWNTLLLRDIFYSFCGDRYNGRRTVPWIFLINLQISATYKSTDF